MRRELKWKVTELEIQKKQKEISDSINISETAHANLLKKNYELLDEIDIKEELLKEIKEKTIEYKENEKKAKQSYLKEKWVLDELNDSIKTLENKKKEFSDENSSLEWEFLKKKEELEKNFQKEKNSFQKTIDTLSVSISSMKDEKNKLLSEIKESKLVLEKTGKNIDENNKKILDQEKSIIYLKDDYEKINSDYTFIKVKKEALESFVSDLEENKSIKLKELNDLEKKLEKISSELSYAKEELEKTRETNVSLIKKEETLNSRATYIKWVYEKAGIPLNI